MYSSEWCDMPAVNWFHEHSASETTPVTRVEASFGFSSAPSSTLPGMSTSRISWRSHAVSSGKDSASVHRAPARPASRFSCFCCISIVRFSFMAVVGVIRFMSRISRLMVRRRIEAW